MLINCNIDEFYKAKMNELKSWQDNLVYEEVEDKGQKVISVR